MNLPPDPPKDTLLIRCPRLGHQIHFSYCRTENLGLPCPRIIHCWQPHFAVEAFLRRELTGDEWHQVFEKPIPPKVLTLVELIEQAQKGSAKSGKQGGGVSPEGAEGRHDPAAAHRPARGRGRVVAFLASPLADDLTGQSSRSAGVLSCSNGGCPGQGRALAPSPAFRPPRQCRSRNGSELSAFVGLHAVIPCFVRRLNCKIKIMTGKGPSPCRTMISIPGRDG